MTESDAVSEIFASKGRSRKWKNNNKKDSTETKKAIKDSEESFNYWGCFIYKACIHTSHKGIHDSYLLMVILDHNLFTVSQNNLEDQGYCPELFV